jgi:alkylhydroperoxidase/carboxymuconolactone decarboxylase family protein YurZ
MDKSAYQIFQQESPGIASAFNKLIEAVGKPSALDPKTKHLIYIAIKIVTGDQGAALAHVPLGRSLVPRGRNCGKPLC